MTNAGSTDTRRDSLQICISPRVNGSPGDGTAELPLGGLPEALSGIAERHGGAQAAAQQVSNYRHIDIVSIAAPGSAVRLPKKPRYEFFIDPLLAGADERDVAEAGGAAIGNTAPATARRWPDLGSALAGVAQLHGSGSLPLEVGDHLRLSVKEVFSTTPFDIRKRRNERIAQTIFLFMTLLLVVPVLGILTHLAIKAWPALSWSFIFDNPKNNMTAGGIWAPLVGTFYLVFISLLVASPIGILAGVYLNEYASDNWFTRIVNLAVVNLAGVPSIVHALFGVGAFVMFAGMGESVLAASCTLAIMTLPVIITSTKEALSSVPMAFREACWNMGASRWQTIRTIVLPNSISGILTGVILQVSRAAGETAPILFTGAAFSVSVPEEGLSYFFPYHLNESCMALSYHLHTVLTQVRGATEAQIAAGEAMPLEHLQYGTAVVLIALVLLVNSMSIGLRVYLRSRKKW